MKYIDADRLRKEIEWRLSYIETATGDYAEGRRCELRYLLSIIDSLQQEQPEVDLEKELNTYYDSPLWDGEPVSWMTYTRIARHFYELGLKTK